MDPEVNMGIFGGIISGLVAAWTYNRFKEQKLPVVFSYFAGEKFPLTMVMILQTIAAVFWALSGRSSKLGLIILQNCSLIWEH